MTLNKDNSNHAFKTKHKLEVKLCKALHTYLIVSQIFCSAPANVHEIVDLSIDKKDNISCNSELFKLFVALLHGIWCMFVCGCVGWASYDQFIYSNVDLPPLQKALYCSEYFINMFSVITTVVGCYRQKIYYRKFIQEIVELDQRLLAFGILPDYLAFKRFLNIHLILLLIFTISTGLVDFFYSHELLINFVRSMFVYVVSNLICNTSLAQYYVLLFGIQLRCNQINGFLAQLKKRTKTLSKSEIKRNGRINNDTTSEVQQNINSMRLIFSSLEHLMQKITSAFAFVILRTFVGSFFLISLQVFIFYKDLDAEYWENPALTVYSIIWVFLHFGRLFCILYYNNAIVAEKGYIALTLNDIDFITPQIDVSINRFLLQLMMDNRILRVCGLIEMDMLFIKGLLFNLSTYVIFLIQYDITLNTLTTFNPSTLTDNDT